MHSTLKKSLFWTFLLALVVLSLMPTGHLPSAVFNIWDKLQHASGYAVLTILGLRAWPARSVWFLAAALLALGGVVELAQAASGWRAGEWTDWLANGVGIGLGIGLTLWVWPFLERRL